MGYYTRFKIDTEPAELRETIGARLAVVSGYGESVDALDDGEERKWYSHSEDCAKVSREFPEATIRIKGIGEEQGDIWVSFWRNGHEQHHRAEAFVGPQTPTDAPWKETK